MLEEGNRWAAKTLQVFGKGCQESQDHKRSHSFNESSTIKDIKATVFQRPRSTTGGQGMVAQKTSHQAKKQHDKRRMKSDSSIDKCSELLNVANFPFEKPKNEGDPKKPDKHLASKNKSKKSNAGTAIADMSKIITKYDEVERRYIGTTIELVKKDSIKKKSGIAIWNRMPMHRLGYPKDKRQPIQRTNIDNEELNQKLKTSVAVKTCDLQDREEDVPCQVEKDVTATNHNLHGGTKARSERVTKFLTDAFEANADILKLGIPFRSAESRIPSVVGNNSPNAHDPIWIYSSNRLGSRSLDDSGTCDEGNIQNKPKHNDSKKVNIKCIHFGRDNNKFPVNADNLDQTGDRCNMCQQPQIKIHKDLTELKVPQAPPTTPTSKLNLKKQKRSLHKIGNSEDFASRYRTQTR